MKHEAWVFATVLLLCGCGRGEATKNEWPSSSDTLAVLLLDSLQVADISLLLSEDADEIKQQLWGTFASRDLANRYSQIEVPSRVRAWPLFRARLLDAATAARRNPRSLARALDDIEKQEEWLIAERQIFPIGAFVAKQRGEKVWVIPCLWEGGVTYNSDGQPRPVRARHLRIWAFLIGNGRQIGYETYR